MPMRSVLLCLFFVSLACTAPVCGDGIIDESQGELCDDGNTQGGDGCRADCSGLEQCGDALTDTEAGEECDDANATNDDGCNNGCTLSRVATISAGFNHTCALLDTGNLRCWGFNGNGELGYGNLNNIGDNEDPAQAGNVELGGVVLQVSAGGAHTCALLDNGKVRCWGSGASGRLGYGNQNAIGDNEDPADAGDVNIGGTVAQVSAGTDHTCALLTTGTVRCWGLNNLGQLGYGNLNNIGDNETPSFAGDLDLGRPAVQVVAGTFHSCALLDDGSVRCWGQNDRGQLGLGDTLPIGDDETPASVPPVDLGAPAVELGAGQEHTCARLATGDIRCWGRADNGQLGYGNANDIGDNEAPLLAGDLNLGGAAALLSAGSFHNCALLSTQELRCWGSSNVGQLGYSNTNSIGDNEAPFTAGSLDLGAAAQQLDAGAFHTCAITDAGSVRCWGIGNNGRLGYGNQNTIGDNEDPADAGDVPLF